MYRDFPSGRSGLSTWKYQLSYDHWSQATVSSVSTWMGDCSSVALVLLLTLKVQCPNPAGTIGPMSRTPAHTCGVVLSVASFTLGSYGWSVSSYRRYRVTPGPSKNQTGVWFFKTFWGARKWHKDTTIDGWGRIRCNCLFYRSPTICSGIRHSTFSIKIHIKNKFIFHRDHFPTKLLAWPFHIDPTAYYWWTD